MSYKLLERNGVANENIDGAAFNNIVTSGADGILKGILNECVISATGSTIQIDTGELILHGFRIKIIEPITIDLNPSIPDNTYQLIAVIDLSPRREVLFDLICRVPQKLIQDSLFDTEQGRYELELAQFSFTSGKVLNLTPTVKELVFSTDDFRETLYEVQQKNIEQDAKIFDLQKKIDDAVLLNPETEEQKINSNIHILGSLLVDGEQTAIETESLFVKDRFIVCNVGHINDSQTPNTAGFAIVIGGRATDITYTYYLAYGIIHDRQTDTVRLGRGYVRVDNTDYIEETQDRLVNPTFFFGTIEFDGIDSYIVHEEEGQAISTRANNIVNGNIPQWDDTQKTFVDSGVSLGDIESALTTINESLDRIIEIQNSLIGGNG